VVVVCVELCVAVVSPIGETVVPLEVDVEPVTTPLTVVVFSLWVSTDAGGGAAGVVVVCVVELEEEDCAKAPPVISAMAIVATSTRLIMLMFPEIRCERGSLASWPYLGMPMRLRQPRKLLNRSIQIAAAALSVPAAIGAAIRMIFAMPTITVAARFDDATGQSE
jgi:hypothetical protein